MTTFHHISFYKPGEHIGGVAVFAGYLKRAIPEMECLSMRDFPEWRTVLGDESLREYNYADILNAWLLESGALNKDSVVICDGFWGVGLPGKVKRLVSVCHGSYYGRFCRAQQGSWGEIVGMDMVEEQFEVWNDPNTEVVCVAQESANELARAGVGHRVEVIYHGIDLDVYRPMDDVEPRIFMHAATDNRKGRDILEAVWNLDSSIPIEFMNVPSGDPKEKARRLNEAIALVAPTRHEGNAYVLLEALACGVPLITYPTGLAIEMDNRCGVVTDDLAPVNILRKIREFDRSLYKPRPWAEQWANFKDFEADWRKYLDVRGNSKGGRAC